MTRILLCLYFLGHALAALIDPRRGLALAQHEKEIMRAERDRVRVGDKL